jgi:RNA polymerase sigma factor (sigma-70 family)
VSATIEQLEELYLRRYVAFRNALVAVAGGREAAHDAVQEGFAQALRDRVQFRGDAPLERWVWRIMIRIAIATRSRSSLEIPALPDDLDLAAFDQERDPELVEALAALPKRRRLIVFLRYFADLSYSDIAEICGISVGTVAASLAQAHDELQWRLEGRKSHAR